MAPPHCLAQAAFVKSVRSDMDANAKKFLLDKDWRKLLPKSARQGTASNKQIDVTSFYVKPIALHALCLMPVCPHCESSNKVETSGSHVRWINTPKTLFGLHSHRCLDTKLCWCSSCRSRFAGYDKCSMQLSAKVWLGYFPFNLSDRFAVDEELHSFIINSANETTTEMLNKLQKLSTDKHHADCQCCLCLVRSKRMRPRNVAMGDGQKRIDTMLGPKKKESAGHRKLRLARERLSCVRRKLQSEQANLDSGLPFESVLNQKHNRNNLGVRLPHLGVSKL